MGNAAMGPCSGMQEQMLKKRNLLVLVLYPSPLQSYVHAVQLSMRVCAACSRWAGVAGGALRRGGSSVHGAVGRIRVPALWHRGRKVQLAAQLSLQQRSLSLLQHPSVRRLHRRRVRRIPCVIWPPLGLVQLKA